MTSHPAISAGGLAVISGGASGIGLAAAKAYAAKGLNVVILDMSGEDLSTAIPAIKDAVKGDEVKVLGLKVDVGDREDVEKASKEIESRFPSTPLTVLMANAGVGGPTASSSWEGWERILAVNLYGVINVIQTFLPRIKAHGKPAVVITTGSKQGITTPPGSGAAYNTSKAAVKVFTEQLANEMRSATELKQISVALLIPGWVHTGLTGAKTRSKPEGAWTPEQTVDFMFERLAAGSFYILCPDNDTPREVDLKRMEWNVNDIIQDRPALSRWHDDHKDDFEAFMKQ